MSGETNTRSVFKAVTWRVAASGITMIIAYVITGSVDVAITIGIFESLLKIIFYYLHERVWGGISWGKK